MYVSLLVHLGTGRFSTFSRNCQKYAARLLLSHWPFTYQANDKIVLGLNVFHAFILARRCHALRALKSM